ncbi:hypothetical protein, partial [Mesorhizobium sp. M7A.F.Ca.CA.001.06.1.1]|uniref:hypothetical protein n=1 Tax=Mesorhizobium sp. M7A.F.Ca.CA.001.06.1.1 TaxID=2496682 RepID=UPI001FE1A9CA
MGHDEAFEASLAQKDDAGAGELEPQVLGERRGEDEISYELGLNDQDRAERRGRNLQHLFPGAICGRPQIGQEQCRDYTTPPARSRELPYKTVSWMDPMR